MMLYEINIPVKHKYYAISMLLVICLLFGTVYSQNKKFDTLVIGNSYNIVLLNHDVHLGKLLYADSVYISILVDKEMIRILKKEIRSISRVGENYQNNYIISFYGGLCVVPAVQYSYTSGSYTSLLGYNAGFDAISSFTNSSGHSQNVRISLSYTHFKKPAHTDEMMMAIYPPVYNKEDESSVNLYTFRTDYILGNVSAMNKFIYFFSSGLGFSSYNESSYKTYFFSNDTLRNTYNISSKNIIALVIAFGISGGYRMNKNFGVLAQIEYNLFTNEEIRERIRTGYIPLKLGMFYYF